MGGTGSRLIVLVQAMQHTESIELNFDGNLSVLKQQLILMVMQEAVYIISFFMVNFWCRNAMTTYLIWLPY